MSRPRKTDAQKRAEGTYRADRAHGNPPAPGGVPEEPAYLSIEARAVWRSMQPALDELGIVACDSALLGAYCEAAADVERLTEEIREEGLTFKTESGFVGRNPKTTILKECRMFLATAGAKLGLSPKDRGNMSKPKKPEDEIDVLDEFRQRAARRRTANGKEVTTWRRK